MQHTLAGIEKIIGQYGDNRLKVSDLFVLLIIKPQNKTTYSAIFPTYIFFFLFFLFTVIFPQELILIKC